jgi:hypothetical protein
VGPRSGLGCCGSRSTSNSAGAAAIDSDAGQRGLGETGSVGDRGRHLSSNQNG